MRELLNQQHQDSSEFATLHSSSASTVSTMTYQQAYDKIIQAYFKEEIQPYNSCFCFCGTLADNSDEWRNSEYGGIFGDTPHRDYGFYSGQDYFEMERALLLELFHTNPGMTDYEEKLFTGMSKALDVLKEIHRSRGEDVDLVTTPFTKRQLA